MFSKATPAADASKLKPGVALPHVTLPTTEVSTGAGRCRGQQVQPPAAAALAADRSPLPPPRVAASEALTMSACCGGHPSASLHHPAGRTCGDWSTHWALAAGGGVSRQARPAVCHLPGGTAGGPSRGCRMI